MSRKISELERIISLCKRSGVKRLNTKTDSGISIDLEFYCEDLVPAPIPEPSYPDYKGLQVGDSFERAENSRLLLEDFDNLPIADPEKYEELLAIEKLANYGDPDA